MDADVNTNWGHSSVGRALDLHSRGRRFDSVWLHQVFWTRKKKPSSKLTMFGDYFKSYRRVYPAPVEVLIS